MTDREKEMYNIKCVSLDKYDIVGIKRDFDNMGRITIPVEYRNAMGWDKGTVVEMVLTDKGVLVKPLD